MNAAVLAAFAANVMLLWMASAWAVARRVGTPLAGDFGLALGWVPVALLCAGFGDALPWRKAVIAVMACAWCATGLARVAGGGRSSAEAAWRALRDQFPKRPWLMFFAVFQVRGILLVLMATPLFLAAFDPSGEVGWTGIAGFAAFVCGLAGSAFGGRSRRPMFEVLAGIGVALFAIGAPAGWAGFVAPAIMYWLRRRENGLPPAEDLAAEAGCCKKDRSTLTGGPASRD